MTEQITVDFTGGDDPAGGGDKKDVNRKHKQEWASKASFQEALTLRDRGAHADAVEVLRGLLREDPSDIDVLFVLGGTLFNLDEYQEAADIFRPSGA